MARGLSRPSSDGVGACSACRGRAALLTDETEHLQVLGDSAYGSGQARAVLTEAGHLPVIKPIRLRPAVPDGFTADDFDIDLEAGTVACPAGLVRTITPGRHAVFGVACRDCPLRDRCTTSSKGRSLTIHEHEALLRSARRQSETADFQQIYRQHRPMVERSIAWLVRGGNRKVRYRGIAKNDQWLHHRLAGINLRRMLALGLAHHNGTWVLA